MHVKINEGDTSLCSVLGAQSVIIKHVFVDLNFFTLTIFEI